MFMYCNVCEDPLLSAHLLKQAVPHQQHHGRESLSAVDNGGSPLGPPPGSSLRWPSSVCSWAGTWRMLGSAGPYWGGGGGPRRAQARLAAPSLSLREGRYSAFPVAPPPLPSPAPACLIFPPTPFHYSTLPSTLGTGHAARAAPVAACGASSLCANHSPPLSLLRPVCPLPHFPPPLPPPAPPPPPFPHFSRSTTYVCAGGSPSAPPRSHPPHSDIGFG